MARQSIKTVHETEIYKAMTKLDLALDNLIVNFNAFAQRTIGVQLSNTSVEIIRYICLAFREQTRRVQYLKRAEANYVTLDYLIRKSQRKGLISNQQYCDMMILQENVSRQLTGWIQSLIKEDTEDE